MHPPHFILANGESLQFILFFSLLPVLSILEACLPRRSTPMRRNKRWPANFGLTAVNIVVLGVLPVSLISAAFFAEDQGLGLLNRIQLPLLASAVIALLVRGFISFFVHYLMHKVPVLWRIHRVHHLDTEMDVSTTVRFHPLEFLVGALLGIPVVVAFGLPPWVLALYELFDVSVTLWSHSNLKLPAPLNRVLRYFVVTPDLHRVHHSAWQPETDSNFSSVFPVWDLVFGTFRAEPRGGHRSMRLGLDEARGPEVHRLLWLLGSPFKRPPEAQSPIATAPPSGRRIAESRGPRPAGHRSDPACPRRHRPPA